MGAYIVDAGTLVRLIDSAEKGGGFELNSIALRKALRHAQSDTFDVAAMRVGGEDGSKFIPSMVASRSGSYRIERVDDPDLTPQHVRQRQLLNMFRRGVSGEYLYLGSFLLRSENGTLHFDEYVATSGTRVKAFLDQLRDQPKSLQEKAALTNNETVEKLERAAKDPYFDELRWGPKKSNAETL